MTMMLNIQCFIRAPCFHGPCSKVQPDRHVGLIYQFMTVVLSKEPPDPKLQTPCSNRSADDDSPAQGLLAFPPSGGLNIPGECKYLTNSKDKIMVVFREHAIQASSPSPRERSPWLRLATGRGCSKTFLRAGPARG
jgi:hypothetical protein